MSWVYNLRAQDPNSDIARVIGISLVFSIVAFLAVCLRFYGRSRTRRTLWLDDYAVLSSSILTLVYAGITVAQTRWGQGLSADYFPPQNIIPFSKIQYAGGPIYTLDLLGFKVALLTSYLRIGGFVDFYRKVILVAIVACVINQVTLTVIMTLVCLPVAKVWDTTIKGHCIHSVEFYYAVAGTSIGFDLIIIALPMPVLWKLQLHVKQKIVLTCLFALGFFVTVIQIIRIFSIANLKEYSDSKNLILWSIVEVSLGIIVACIPTYGPLFKSFASTVHSYRRRDTGPSYPLGSTHLSSPRENSRAKDSEHTIYGSEEMRNKTVVGSGKRADIPKTSDAESEEHILSEDGQFYIHTTTEVMIERE